MRDAPEPLPLALDGFHTASKFLGRLARLDCGGIVDALHCWRLLVADQGDDWCAAEDALARALARSGRRPEQELLLEYVMECFRRARWFPAAPANAHAARRASAEYIATVAVLALLVRDHIGAPELGLLCGPFGQQIPLAELERE